MAILCPFMVILFPTMALRVVSFSMLMHCSTCIMSIGSLLGEICHFVGFSLLQPVLAGFQTTNRPSHLGVCPWGQVISLRRVEMSCLPAASSASTASLSSASAGVIKQLPPFRQYTLSKQSLWSLLFYSQLTSLTSVTCPSTGI